MMLLLKCDHVYSRGFTYSSTTFLFSVGAVWTSQLVVQSISLITTVYFILLLFRRATWVSCLFFCQDYKRRNHLYIHLLRAKMIYFTLNMLKNIKHAMLSIYM